MGVRKIKFRGKRLDNGEWVYGYLVNNIYINKGNPYTHIFIENHCLIRIDPETVGQFTDLFDKNGNEIYEGDIVKDKRGGVDAVTYDSIAYNLLIAYASTPEGVCVKFFGKDNPLVGIEVIGNIHDTPELLKGE